MISERPSLAVFVIPTAVGLGAFLLFGVQPMVAKAILPWFGGTAAVWTTCLLVFQVGLLVGYGYAYAMAAYVPLRLHGVIHVALVAAACFVPVLPGESWKPTGGEALAPLVVPMLAASVGPRFVMLAASGTLLQHWYSRLFPGRSPWPLYALSNGGSLLALLAYPLLAEPLLPLAEQRTWWTVAFFAFAGLSGVTAWTVFRRGAPATGARLSADDPGQRRSRASLRETLFRTGWSAAGVILLMATTQQLTINMASTPFLWILPLAVYLVSFIVTFASGRTYPRPLFVALSFPALFAVYPATMGGIGFGDTVLYEIGYPTQVACLLAAQGVFSMICHGELYRRRPAPAGLTAFYFSIALGGALGGAAVALLAPRLFLFGEELHAGIVMVLVLLAAAAWRSRDRAGRWTRVLVPLCALMTVALLVSHAALLRRNAVWIERNDYGLLRVLRIDSGEDGLAHRRLYDGVTLHGAQFEAPQKRREPTTYYSIAGGGGALLMQLDESAGRKIGVIGLGTGTLATYGRPGDHFRFFEINPAVVTAAREHFTFLEESAARCEIELGDARLVLERAPAQEFDVLVLDAFSSDAIPVHLLTVEAFETFLGHLKPGGVIAAHISNRSLDLSPLLYGLAERYDLRALNVVTREGRPQHLISRSNWMLLSTDTGLFESLSTDLWPWVERGVIGLYVGDPERYRSVSLWTDDYSNLLQVLK